MEITAAEITGLLGEWFWPFLRVGGMVMVAPIFGGRQVPVQARVVLALGLSFVMVPAAGTAPAVEILSLQGILIAVQEILIGVIMGFLVQMVFDAVVIAGQLIAMSMGLGFAMMVDSQEGVNIPVVGQFLVIMTTLLYLAMDGHLILLSAMASSFEYMPIGRSVVVRDDFWSVVEFGSRMYLGAAQIALPAVAALQTVLIAFGVMSRAAPTMNLFAVGFPAAMTLGFLIIMTVLPYMQPAIMDMLDAAFGAIDDILGSD